MPSKIKRHFLAVQSFGLIQDDKDSSRGANGSRSRLDYAIHLIESGYITGVGLVALFPQGVSKLQPEKIDPSQTSLGENMAGYVKERLAALNAEVLTSTLGWGTLADVTNTYNMVRDLGYNLAHINFVSDPVHIKRVKLVWDKTHPYGWTASFFSAKSHRLSSWERWVREPVARFVYRCRLLFYKRN